MRADMVVEYRRWQFTVKDFARMVEAGILAEDDRVELIEGEVREMAPIGSRHASTVKRLNVMIIQLVANSAIVGIQDPIQLNDYSQPEPDISILRNRDDYYASSHPLPEDVLLVVEVADTSLRYDREEKIPLYAQAEIPEVWLADIDGEIITRYTDPEGNHYSRLEILGRGRTIESTTVENLRLDVNDIFG